MELRLLGPVELRSAGRTLDAGPARQRCVLAALAMSAGRPVSTSTLIDRVWGEEQPADVRAGLYTYLSRLRRVLVADAGPILRRAPGGYVLELARSKIDALRFRDEIEHARRLTADDQRLAQLREALALWRGEPLTGIAGEWAESVRASLHQLRLSALTDRIDIELRNDHHGRELVDELEQLVGENPIMEQLAGQLMRALCHAGRTAEALAVFARTRHRLADELGNDPGPELRQLHQQILRQDPDLNPSQGVRGSPGESPPEPPRQLPIAPATFVGRDPELAAVTEVLIAPDRQAPAIVAISGPGGVGKSALALRAAQSVSGHYPDGQLYLDLQGSSPGSTPMSSVEALGRLLQSLGVRGAATPADAEEAAARFRTLLADRRILLLLDNAADTAQVRPLLPASAACGVIVTSRSVLSSLGDARQVGLTVLQPAGSVELLTRLDPTGRVAADQPRASALAELCGHLPLALRITAARIVSRPSWPLATFVDRLSDERHRLDHLGHEDHSVRACFQASYDALRRGDADDQAAAHAFRLLGLPDGPDISLPIAARLLDTPTHKTERILDRLVDSHLLESTVAGRFRFHDLVRLYARELTQDEVAEADRYDALERAWHCYVVTAGAASQLMRPGHRRDLIELDPEAALPLATSEQGVAWFRDECANLLAVARQAAVAPGHLPAAAVRLGYALFTFMHANLQWRDLSELVQTSLGVVRRLRDRDAEGVVVSDAGVMAWLAGDGEEAVRLFAEAVAICRERGQRASEARALLNLGNAYAERGELGEAVQILDESVAVCREAGYRAGQAYALNTMAHVNGRLGKHDLSAAQFRAAVAIYEENGDQFGQAVAQRRLGHVLLERGEFADALQCYEEALKLGRECAAGTGGVWALAQAGEAHRRLGNPQRAVELCEEALAESRRIGSQQENALALWRLGSAYGDLGDRRRAESLWREALPIFDQLGAPEAAEVRQLLDVTAGNSPVR
ncbi:MAG: BTAD domain-containing putative transcriptional regulator [Micromonosporaceae bacterium]